MTGMGMPLLSAAAVAPAAHPPLWATTAAAPLAPGKVGRRHLLPAAAAAATPSPPLQLPQSALRHAKSPAESFASVLAWSRSS